MPKEILVLSGSPRKGGNTDSLVAAFRKGAEAAGHSVTVRSVGNNQVRGCIACDTCWSKGVPCSVVDGFNDLAPDLERADVLVFATPIYFFGITAQLKAALDKLYSYLRAPTPLRIGAAALICAAGDTGDSNFAGAVETYKNAIAYLKWRDAGILLVPGVYAKGDVEGSPYLAKAEAGGQGIAERSSRNSVICGGREMADGAFPKERAVR